MNKPSNYDNISLHRDPIKLGGHYAVIKQVVETTSKTGKEQVVIYIDFDLQDEQRGYFENVYRSDTRSEKKWPIDGTMYITNNRQDIYERNIKEFVTAVEESNNWEAKWMQDPAQWGAQFKNKKVGVVYGEEENVYRDELRINHKIRFFCDVHKALDQDVPKRKGYRGMVGTQTTDMAATMSEGFNVDEFMNIPDGVDDGLPFN